MHPHASYLPTYTQVAADGANSKVRSLCHVGAWGWDYDQRGVVCTIRTDVPHTTAWQRFLPTGPVAMLPVRRRRLSRCSVKQQDNTPHISPSVVGWPQFHCVVHQPASCSSPAGPVRRRVCGSPEWRLQCSCRLCALSALCVRLFSDLSCLHLYESRL